MHTNQWQFARPMLTGFLALASCIALIGAPLTVAQAPAASGDAAQAPSPEELEKLVGPIALYPDDLVAIILPASTNPLQIVQADRFLQKRKQDPKAPIDDRWDDSVKALVNYPEIVKQMSTDLDWTAALGEAVVADQGAVLGAVQAFRRKAQSAGNLKSDDKQVVTVEKEIVTIVPANPEVIYVPQYNPSTVVVYSSAPVYGYWPAPYPVYSYPYAPGAAFATGLIWGAAIGAAWNGGWGCNWSGGTINNNININRGDVNVGSGNRGQGNRPQQRPSQGSAWKSDKRPGQVSSGAGRPTQTSGRVGDARGGGGGAGGFGGGGAGSRPSAQPAGGGFGQGGAGSRPSTQQAGGGFGQGGGGARNQAGAVSSSGAATRTGGGGGDAFGGYGSGNAARADSSRGAASRNSMSSGGSRPSAGSYGGAGGASRGGGGGGRGGGGGGGGGRGGGGGGRR